MREHLFKANRKGFPWQLKTGNTLRAREQGKGGDRTKKKKKREGKYRQGGSAVLAPASPAASLTLRG